MIRFESGSVGKFIKSADLRLRHHRYADSEF